MDSLHENHTYELTELPKGKRVLQNKWVYKLKPREGGKSTQIQSPNRVERLSVEGGCGFRLNIFPSREDDIHTDDVEYCDQHGLRNRTTGCENGFPSWTFGGRNLHAVVEKI